jgi:NADPH-dependent 2,4-dienoyl-CoA reductase/sulfur reductase-like enzyme
MRKKRLVAIGCGGAGMFSLIVASQLRKGRYETTVLSDEKDVYCRCTTPYVLTGEAELSDAIQPESMFSEYGLDIVHDKAVGIDTERRIVTTESGKAFPYDSLVIATGASPFVPPVPGADSDRVHAVRTSDDVASILRDMEGARRAVVVGAGVIGIEMAGALREKGLDVSVVEMAESVSPDLADAEFAEKILGHLHGNGIHTIFGSSVTSIRDAEDGSKDVSVEGAGEAQSLSADLVILAAGVRPNLDVVRGTDIRTSQQGVIVDRRMRTNIPGVYSCGDCCVSSSSVTGERCPSALASSAIQQAKIVGFQIVGFPIRYAGSTGAFAFGTLGKEYAAVGLTEDAARKRYRMVVVGRAETTDIYEDMKSSRPLSVKLVFAGPRMRLVGYEAFGNGVIASADVASFAIGRKTGVIGMLRYGYIAHPNLTPWPFMDPIIMATEDALGNLVSKLPFRKRKTGKTA